MNTLIGISSSHDYIDFADDAKFGWVTQASQAVMPANYMLLISLLITRRSSGS